MIVLQRHNFQKVLLICSLLSALLFSSCIKDPKEQTKPITPEEIVETSSETLTEEEKTEAEFQFEDEPKEYQMRTSTYLKIVSDYTGSYTGSSSNPGYIYRVGLVGYSFDDLKICYKESKTFELERIPGGLENVNISVSFRPDDSHYDSHNPASIKCNFSKDKTTVITLTSKGTLIENN